MTEAADCRVGEQNSCYRVVSAVAKSGKPYLKLICGSSEKLLHSSYDPVREAAGLVDSFNFNGNGLLVVLGLGIGYHVSMLSERYPEADIVVVEALTECLQLAQIHGNVNLERANLRCIAGVSATNALRQITNRQIETGMPPLTLFTLPSAAAVMPDYYQQLVHRLTASSQLDLAGRLRYSRFRSDSLKILIFDCGYFLTREISTALARLGHSTARIKFSKESAVSDIIAELISKTSSFRPDFCIAINHLGFDEEGIITTLLKSIELPVASWFVDSPELILKGFENNVSPYTALFTWDRSFIDSMETAGFESVSFLPLATDPEIFKPISPTSPGVRRLTAGVGFVGSSMVARLKDKLDKVPKELHQAVDTLAEKFIRGQDSIDALLDLLDSRLKQRIMTLDPRSRLAFDTAVTWRATLKYRCTCLNQLKQFKPVIHGDMDWSSLLDSDFEIRPPLDYYRTLPDFYSTCSVNFNATNLQMGTAVNQRLFDIPACGGFLLTDHQSSLEDLFCIGEEVAVYRETGEIAELAKYFLANPPARTKMAIKGRERVLRQHTYQHRLAELVERMRTRFRH